MILQNGVIYTMDAAAPRLAALPITRDGRVARGVEAWEGEASVVSPQRVDLDGRVVVPGFCDAHLHFRDWALSRRLVDLRRCASARDCAARAAEATPARSGWIIGHGWYEPGYADADGIDAELLDDSCGRVPVALWARDHHSLWLSSAAMAAVGIGAGTQPPPGGVIERRRDGSPSGVVREEAAWRVPLPEPTLPEAEEAVRDAQRAAHAQGVTMVHDMQAHGGFGLWQRLDAAQRLTLRVCSSIRHDRLDAARQLEVATGFGNERLVVGPVKAFMDGTLGSRTARMLEPYEDGGNGIELLTREALAALVAAAATAGLAVAVHAIGDRAVRDALDAFGATRPAWSAAGLTPRIEHAQLVDPADTPRFAELGVIASMQPAHQPLDAAAADAAWGPRAAHAFPLRSLLDHGALVVFGSDAPIEPVAPLAAIQAAVHRSLDERPSWRPDQSIHVAEALFASTRAGALSAPWPQRLGMLAPGFAADLVILERDPFACHPAELARIAITATMVQGRFVHGRPPW